MFQDLISVSYIIVGSSGGDTLEQGLFISVWIQWSLLRVGLPTERTLIGLRHKGMRTSYSIMVRKKERDNGVLIITSCSPWLYSCSVQYMCAGPAMKWIGKCKDSLFQINLKTILSSLILESFVVTLLLVRFCVCFCFWGGYHSSCPWTYCIVQYTVYSTLLKVKGIPLSQLPKCQGSRHKPPCQASYIS